MKTGLTALALCALAPAALAADGPPQDLARDIDRDVQLALAELPARLASSGRVLSFAGHQLEGERTVKGAPYCATMVHENVQTLADGNRIVRGQTSQICRDGEGRTRREVQREGASRVVYLNDPVARESWVLYPDQKRMQRLRGSPVTVMIERQDAAAQAAWQASMQAWGERMREQAARWREWGARVAEQARSADADRVRAQRQGGEPGIVIERELVLPAPGASAPQLRRELRVLRASELPAPPAMPALPAVPSAVPPVPASLPMPPLLLQGALGLSLPREGGVTTALPARDIDGVKAHGERTTWTIAAGSIGNERPIVISREVWRSPELMLTLSSREADPRVGEQNYRLEKIRRGEPDAALMKPPADYTDAPRPAARR